MKFWLQTALFDWSRLEQLDDVVRFPIKETLGSINLEVTILFSFLSADNSNFRWMLVFLVEVLRVGVVGVI